MNTTTETNSRPGPAARCVECRRAFDLCDEIDADEWAYGHDCEE